MPRETFAVDRSSDRSALRILERHPLRCASCRTEQLVNDPGTTLEDVTVFGATERRHLCRRCMLAGKS
jgi:hypothetical protein